MRVSTRLLVILLPVVTVVMSGYAAWALTDREEVLVEEAHRETRAYAVALSLALEEAVRHTDHEHLQEIINQVSRVPSGHVILVYNDEGLQIYSSDTTAQPDSVTPDELRAVLQHGTTVALEREMGGERTFAVLRPIRDASGGVSGALVVAEPLALVDAAKRTVRSRYLLNTITLLVALILVTLWLVRLTVARPMEALVNGVRAVGRGELGHRVGAVTGTGELAELGREIDSMAGSLETARSALIRESQERVALERRLRESENMARIGTIAAGLAHEIAAPLNVISGRSELLLRRDAPADVRERHLRSILTQVGRITRIVDSLLHFARRREPRLQPVDAAAVADGVSEMLEAEFARAEVRLERCDTRPLAVSADPDLLHQVLANLLLNGVQALEGATGERRVTLSSGEDAAAGPGWRYIAVADSGPGIAFEMREQVFTPFFTTKEKGTGLGLALARSMVEELGGRLEVEAPSAGRGAVFRVVLPAAEDGHG